MFNNCTVLSDFHALLEYEAKQLVKGGIKGSTRRTYCSAQNQYIEFCQKLSIDPLPASENTLLMYVAYLNRRSIKHSTISVYLAAVRSLHVEEGFPYPLEDRHRLKRALNCVKIEGGPPKKKLPITFSILWNVLNYISSNYNHKLIWAAMTLAYFACLRAAEFCVRNKFYPAVNLTMDDIKLNSNHLVLHLKSSKTDKFRQGVNIYVGCSGTRVCSFCSMLEYLKERKKLLARSNALFIFENNVVLTKKLFVNQFRLLLALAGYTGEYSGHSFRRGGATDAATAGLMDWELKLFGRWSSDAYQQYIQTRTSVMVNFANRIAISPEARASNW